MGNWSVDAGQLTLHVTAPGSTFAAVTVPTSEPQSVVTPAQAVPAGPATYYLPSGKYTFTAAH